VSAHRSGTLRLAVLTVLGSGYLRPAPASWGSLVSTTIFAAIFALLTLAGAPPLIAPLVCIAGIIAAATLSAAWGGWAVAHFGSKDPRPFVLDEFAGQWLALLWLPPLASVGAGAAAWVIGGQFVLFRIFDVLKPPPAAQLERLPAGWGILCDDLMAGVYANIAGQLIWRLTPLATLLEIHAASAAGG
jgi:phosphatidylglycerophosphatase A